MIFLGVCLKILDNSKCVFPLCVCRVGGGGGAGPGMSKIKAISIIL